MNDKKNYHGSKRNPLKITISWIFVFWRGKSHKLGHVATLSGLVLGPILMTSLRILLFWPQICKGNILPVQLIPKVISFSIWTQFCRPKHCPSSTLTDWNQTSTTSQKWLNFKRKPLYLIRTIKELIESYSFLDITNPHSVIDVVIPIIVIYHYSQALKLNCFDTTLARFRLILRLLELNPNRNLGTELTMAFTKNDKTLILRLLKLKTNKLFIINI